MIKSALSRMHPKYVHPDPPWAGLGDAMDSRAYPEKGYRGGIGKSDAKTK